MAIRANPNVCPGFTTNGYDIHSDCRRCLLWERSIGASGDNLIWRQPPKEMPCSAWTPRDRGDSE